MSLTGSTTSLVAKRMELIQPSATLSLTQKAAELKREGRDILSLTVGEPDFDTPLNIKEAAITAIKEGFTKYTNTDGIPELKMAIQKKFSHENNISYELREIIVSSGGKQVIYNILMASLNPGEEVIIPAPYWVSYPDITILAGGTPVIVKCSLEDNFKMNGHRLRNAITPKTKWVIINSPSNPTGAVYTKGELEEIAEVMREQTHIYALVDDMYEHIVFDGIKFHTLAEIAPDLKHRIFTINGVSKAYSMTGWRIGYGAGPHHLVKAMTIIQSQSTSNPCSISQMAAVEAISGDQSFIKTNSNTFQEKRDLVLHMLHQIHGMKCLKPQGAFYLFPSCATFFGKKRPDNKMIEDSDDFASYLLEFANLAVVPGSAFGLEGYFRISYATSKTILHAACQRLVDACDKLV
jgi:aspartate aminotransferase